MRSRLSPGRPAEEPRQGVAFGRSSRTEGLGQEVEPQDRVSGADYEVISLKISWAVLSILFFLLTLPARDLLQLLPWRPQRIWIWPLIPPLVILGLSLLGFFAGLLGLKFSANKGIAKTGVFLNGVVAAIILAIAAAWFYIVAGR